MQQYAIMGLVHAPLNNAIPLTADILNRPRAHSHGGAASGFKTRKARCYILIWSMTPITLAL